MSEATTVRTATPDDRIAVHRLVDGAMLEVSDLDARLERGDVLLAIDAREERALGTLVTAPVAGGREILAVAVRRSRRDRGIGSELVEAADREGRLVAEFDADVRPFYESLGFSIRKLGDENEDGDTDRERYEAVRG